MDDCVFCAIGAGDVHAVPRFPGDNFAEPDLRSPKSLAPSGSRGPRFSATCSAAAMTKRKVQLSRPSRR